MPRCKHSHPALAAFFLADAAATTTLIGTLLAMTGPTLLRLSQFGPAGAAAVLEILEARSNRIMNPHPSYTLASRSDTGRSFRSWNVLTRGTLASTFLAADLSLIVAMSCLTGIGYHLAVYGQPGEIPSYFRVGVLVASIFVISNFLRDEYKIDNLFSFRPHRPALVPLSGTAPSSACSRSASWRRSPSPIPAAGCCVLRLDHRRTVLAALAVVQLTARAVAAGIISARRIFLVGTGRSQRVSASLRALEARDQYHRLPVPHAHHGADRKEWRDTIERDLDDAAASARILEPDAVFLVLPWSATRDISLCADKFTRSRPKFISRPSRSSTVRQRRAVTLRHHVEPAARTRRRCRGWNSRRSASSISSSPRSGSSC